MSMAPRARCSPIGRSCSAYRDEKEARGAARLRRPDRRDRAACSRAGRRGLGAATSSTAASTTSWSTRRRTPRPTNGKSSAPSRRSSSPATGPRDSMRTFFAVGDEKQSIYSFQGARPREFARMRREIERRVKSRRRIRRISSCTAFVPLQQGHPGMRSTAMFSLREIVTRAVSSDETEPGPSKRWKGDLPGLIELWPGRAARRVGGAARLEDAARSARGQRPAGRGGEEHRARNRRADRARLRRRACEDDATRGRRPIRPGDMMILVRSRGPFFEEMIRALKEAQVPVAGADRLAADAAHRRRWT